MSSTTAENYQLKWHSHLSNLNTSVCTLYRNEKFADVMLLTSNHQEGGAGIPAHKLILSSCSHYFANVFENNISPPNSLIYVVLPPELSRRSINILVQYMYSGEATVSNDILNEVLRGGELLKIRGLWRNNTNTNNTNGQNNSVTTSTSTTSNNTTNNNDNVINNNITNNNLNSTPQFLQQTIIPEKIITESTPVSRIIKRESFSCERSPIISEISTNGNVIPKDSPVIVISSSSSSSIAPPLQLQQHQPQPQQPTITQNQQVHPTLIVKKDVAIDPSDNNIPSTHNYGLVSLQIAAAKKAQNSEKRLKNLERNENGLERITKFSNNDATIQQHRQHTNDELEQYEIDTRSKDIIRVPEKKIIERKIEEVVIIPEALNFLTIKQEPVEWIEYDDHNGTEKTHMEISVKPEILYGEDDEDSNDNQEPVYSPLTCELCSETFTIPGEWVRHIENHAETTHNIPKKRRRIDDNTTENIAALRCDLCSMYFVNPHEWVRHVQNIHTETELAISNNSALPKRTIRTQRPIDGQQQPLEKSCSICNKTFPSYASMIIHKRTHTGERPFYCSQCNKGFNVKSNLLRHMRTLHNQFMSTNSSNCNDGENSNPE